MTGDVATSVSGDGVNVYDRWRGMLSASGDGATLCLVMGLPSRPVAIDYYAVATTRPTPTGLPTAPPADWMELPIWGEEGAATGEPGVLTDHCLGKLRSNQLRETHATPLRRTGKGRVPIVRGERLLP